jgi:hypothetical protein
MRPRHNRIIRALFIEGLKKQASPVRSALACRIFNQYVSFIVKPGLAAHLRDCKNALAANRAALVSAPSGRPARRAFEYAQGGGPSAGSSPTANESIDSKLSACTPL